MSSGVRRLLLSKHQEEDNKTGKHRIFKMPSTKALEKASKKSKKK